MAFQLERIARNADHRGQHDQQQAEAVDADVVAGAERGDPLRLFDELVVLGVVEVEDQRQRDQEADERGDIGPELDGARVRRRNEQQHQEADQWREQDDREDVVHSAANHLITLRGGLPLRLFPVRWSVYPMRL